MNINSTTLPKCRLRNNQSGDWMHNPDGSITAISAELGDEKFECLVQIHEIIEAILTKFNGITDEMVTAFDAQFEKERESGIHKSTDENGDDPRACYFREHQFATLVERLMAREMGVIWADYEARINSL